ncbi:MAG TPA: thiolase domain-containing protein [Nitrososphaerales archaeon]|nr:thiolase domain-containing protein [Nitrososphaerales archaeon]
MRNVAIVGYGLCKFGKREGSLRDLAVEAGKSTIESLPNLQRSEIEGFFLTTTDGEPYVAASVSENLGLKPKLSAKIENLCASGGMGITVALGAVASGLVDVCMVLGAEKMSHLKIAPPMEWDFTRGGIMPPAVWGAMYAQRHMREFGTREEDLALVSVKNHKHSSMNPFAQFQKPVTLEEVMHSREIVSPIKLFDCSAKTDGAAGVILASEDHVRKYTDSPVWIIGSGQSSIGASFGNVNPQYTTWPAVKLASADGFRSAGVGPGDIDVAELHDAFTINEIIEYEDVGFVEKGKGGSFIREGQSQIGGKVAVNTNGGLIGAGHPIGATGVAQAIEITQQLRNEAGKRQVNSARIGYTLNLSASVSTASVLVYSREKKGVANNA